MSDELHRLHIEEWLLALSVFCKARTPTDLKPTITAYAKDLAHHPAMAFTEISRLDAQRKWKWFPDFRALDRFLEKFVDGQKPKQRLIGSSEGDGLAPETRVYVDAFLRNRDATSQTGDKIKNVEVALSALRNAKPEVFAHLIKTDDQCRRIAERRGWADRLPLDVTEFGIGENVANLERAVADITEPVGLALVVAMLSLLRVEVTRRAEHLLHLVPESLLGLRPKDADGKPRSVEEQRAALGAVVAQAVTDPARDAFRATHGREMGSVSAEHLAALRRANGIPAPFANPLPPPGPPRAPLGADPANVVPLERPAAAKPPAPPPRPPIAPIDPASLPDAEELFG